MANINGPGFNAPAAGPEAPLEMLAVQNVMRYFAWPHETIMPTRSKTCFRRSFSWNPWPARMRCACANRHKG